MELLSVAMLIVISTFALDFIHTDRSIFKIVDLDEAWSFLQVAQGKNTIYEAGSGWSCYERWGIFRDPKYRRPLR